MVLIVGVVKVKEGRLLFVNKKQQKNFFDWDSACGDGPATSNYLRSRSFLVLFFKKEPLASPIR
jgi:hypothetical protein